MGRIFFHFVLGFLSVGSGAYGFWVISKSGSLLEKQSWEFIGVILALSVLIVAGYFLLINSPIGKIQTKVSEV